MIDTPAKPKRDREALMALLAGAQVQAAATQQSVLVSISLRVELLEPLAVLESIWERSEWHAYLENMSEERAFAAAEAVALAEFSGASRTTDAEAWLNSVLGRCIEAGDTEDPLSGPQAMIGMTFADHVPENSAFAPLTVWIPRWQIHSSAEQTVAVANAMIAADTDLEQVADRMLRAHGKFAQFDYSQQTLSPDQAPSFQTRAASNEAFTDGVAKAVKDIKSGAFKKVVLARSETLVADQDLSPIDPIARMREQFWGCHCFAFGNATGTTFIGATPELLFELQDDSLKTHALAGSIARGSQARDDAELGNALMQSSKDRHEQELVREAIERRLNGLHVETQSSSTPKLLKLKNIQHLNTKISGILTEPVSFWKILDTLHPTPAVGGSPRAIAVSRLNEYESLDRSLYAGTVGMVNRSGNGRMYVAIRSAAVSKKSLTLYAGAGIVAGSDPHKEWKETDLKLNAMRSVFEQ